jgi:isopenicillin N synthase-like dioxygenase
MTVKINGKELPFPIVSFAPFLNGGKAERTLVAQQLYDAFHVYGWVYLKDFGISEEEIDAMFARVRQKPSTAVSIQLTMS